MDSVFRGGELFEKVRGFDVKHVIIMAFRTSLESNQSLRLFVQGKSHAENGKTHHTTWI
jgi:hypothetical protein